MMRGSECARGQVMVELAVALPFLLFLILGTVEVGFLLIAKANQDRSTAVVAEWAADHPGESWNSVAGDELRGCDVSVEETLPHRIVEATSRCLYRPAVLVMLARIPISSRESAVTRRYLAPEPSPVASPS